MGTVNDWAGAIGGTILGLELIVLLLIGVALNAGIAFGLYWVLKKMGWVRAKRIWATDLFTRYLNKGMNVIAAPVIVTTSFWRGLKAGLHRATHWTPTAHIPASTPPIAERGQPVTPSRAA